MGMVFASIHARFLGCDRAPKGQKKRSTLLIRQVKELRKKCGIARGENDYLGFQYGVVNCGLVVLTFMRRAELTGHSHIMPHSPFAW